MKQPSSIPTELLLRHEECDVGLIRVEHREGRIWSGHVQLSERVKSRVGWQARRFADALDAMATYLEIRDQEGENSTSKRFKAAVAQLERGEIGHYLFESKGWHAVDEMRTARGLNLLNYYHDGRIAWQWRSGVDLKPFAPQAQQVFAPAKSLLGHRLVLRDGGRHAFGGPPRHRGVVPTGTKVPLHHLLTIDLADLRSPLSFKSSGIRYLPLYYPLAYGDGGARIQYLVCGDDRIKIIHISDSQPDDPANGMLTPELPATGADFVELTYEELRTRVISEHPSFTNGLSPKDQCCQEALRENRTILLGGALPLELGLGRQRCQNPDCSAFKTIVELELLACFPPVAADGRTKHWGNYDDSYLRFYFGLCPCCRSVIASNFCD